MSTEGDYKCVIQTDTEGEDIVQATASETSSTNQSIQCTVPLVSPDLTIFSFHLDNSLILPQIITAKYPGSDVLILYH